jgi:CDP-6-deoxy-D-xylo-4-hexulose-3-dehydrase
MKVQLVKDTIDKNDIEKLIEWLETNPRLTKGDYTTRFERLWSLYTGVKYSIYVNSGSSANLAMAYALKVIGKLRNNIVIAPVVSWVTTVAPFMQLGFDVKLVDCDKDTLGPDIDHLKQLIEKYNPATMILVHVLGVPSKMREIMNLCQANNITLLEDSCECVGSSYQNIKTGNFGIMSSFSLYFGHHLSTIEGGMVCTNDKHYYNVLKSIRAHGWDRDLDEDFKKELKKGYEVDEFKDLYTFYYPGFNLRSTDLQAFIGCSQMEKITHIVTQRHENYKLYHSLIENNYWKINPTKDSWVSAFAYPIITPKLKELVKALKENDIETRPLICGSIANQPFWTNVNGKSEEEHKMADDVDKFGCYLPNNHQIGEKEIKFVCDVVNEIIKVDSPLL